MKKTATTIQADKPDQRIDNFLFNKLKNIPKSCIYKMIRGGEVRVNKGRVLVSYKLKLGDMVRIPPVWTNEAVTNTSKRKPNSKMVNLLLNNIIFEDKKILVVNKPSGIATHGGSGINFGVIEVIRYARPELKSLELVHRIDKDTSGCLILSKKHSALRELHQMIRDHLIVKKYLLLVRGKWSGGLKTVKASLLKNQLSSGERIVKVSEMGKQSETIFKPLKIKSEMSLLEAELKTGRTHQIRVHATYIGYPIAGDEKYGDKDFNKKMKKHGLHRLFLHAREIKFVWSDKSQVHIIASLDDKLSQIIN